MLFFLHKNKNFGSPLGTLGPDGSSAGCGGVQNNLNPPAEESLVIDDTHSQDDWTESRVQFESVKQNGGNCSEVR